MRVELCTSRLNPPLLKTALSENSHARALASEEEEQVVALHQTGKYIVVFDPLDGSSNIDINGQIGTIFTIYPALENAAADELSNPAPTKNNKI